MRGSKAVIVATIALVAQSYNPETEPLFILPEAAVHTYLPWNYPCTLSSNEAYPFCNTSLSYADRANDYVSRLSVSELVGLSGNNAHGPASLDVAAYEWWTEGLHGVAHSPGMNFYPVDYATNFPQVILTASSFNRSLWKAIGDAISTEGRAFHNLVQASLTFWTPNINVYRDPRWGRGQETPGEDPFINSEYAANFVTGFQAADGENLRASACCKHYAAYSMEAADGYTRHNFDAIVSDYDFNDTYFPAFKSCVMEGKVSSVMCSYNAVNGVPSCANTWLLTDVLRDTWGFDGYITSDCGAVKDIQENHHYTNTTDATMEVAFGSGMDSDCGQYTQTYGVQAVTDGVLPLATLQRAIFDLTVVQMRLGMWDNPTNSQYANLNEDNIATKAHLRLSYQAARQGVVLVKNDGVLPLSNGQIAGQQVAVVGPTGNQPAVNMANYFGQPPFITTIFSELTAIQIDAGKVNPEYVTYSQGCYVDQALDGDTVNAAINVAKSASVVFLTIGIDQQIEAEGRDRTTITLPANQISFVSDLLNAIDESTPVIMVVTGGGCLDLEDYYDDSRVNAIVWSSYGGMYGGRATIDAIMGKFSPAGRFTQTWYKADYVNELMMDDMRMRSNSTDGYVGRGYRYYSKQDTGVVFPFGYGLGYTQFDCFDFSFNSRTGKMSLTIENVAADPNSANPFTGSADAVVMVYWVPTNTNQPLIRRLVAFDRVSDLEIGASASVSMDVYSEFMLHQEYLDSGSFALGGACAKTGQMEPGHMQAFFH